MSYNPTIVANYFIKISAPTEYLTPMKVIQLTYIAYGWYLALTDNKERLLNEFAEAREYGPIFPSLFLSLKKYGKLEITGKIPNPTGDNNILPDDKKFLDRVWDIYGRFDDIYLGALMHRNDTPWKSAYLNKYCSIISDDALYEHYKGKMKRKLSLTQPTNCHVENH